MEHELDRAARVAVETRREMTGFVATLSPAQQEAAKAYRGDEPHGDDEYTRHPAVDAILAHYNAIDAVANHKPLAIIESPYAGHRHQNMEYARACLLDSLRRGEAPIASHLLHTQVLDDLRPDERELGIEAGLAWYRVAEKCVVYADRGISKGMLAGIERARVFGVEIEERYIEVGV